MKKLKKFYTSLLLASVLLTGCGGKTDTTIVQETAKTQIDSLSGQKPNDTTVQDTTASKVTVRIFFRTRDLSGYEGYEGYEFTKPEISEREDFRTKNSFTYCYDSEEFDHLLVAGNDAHLTLEIRDEEKVVFSKSDFSIKDTMQFTTKDFELNMGSIYTISLSQNGKRLFNGKIDSEGCM